MGTKFKDLCFGMVQYLKKFLLEYHTDAPLSSSAPMFYSVIHDEQYPLSDRHVRYPLREYASKVRLTALKCRRAFTRANFVTAEQCNYFKMGWT
jgi:hypothetical protein